jgi:hypothetical protein
MPAVPRPAVIAHRSKRRRRIRSSSSSTMTHAARVRASYDTPPTTSDHATERVPGVDTVTSIDAPSDYQGDSVAAMPEVAAVTAESPPSSSDDYQGDSVAAMPEVAAVTAESPPSSSDDSECDSVAAMPAVAAVIAESPPSSSDDSESDSSSSSSTTPSSVSSESEDQNNLEVQRPVHTVLLEAPDDSEFVFPDPALCDPRLVGGIFNTIDEFLLLDARTGNKAEIHWSRLLMLAFPPMARHPLRMQLALLALTCYRNRSGGRSKYDFIEFFAGAGGITKAHHAKGMSGVQFDCTISPLHDCSTPQGVRLWFSAILLSNEDALFWHGTECKSFVRMCMHQSGRRKENDFEGNISRPFVASGNTLMQVTSLQIFFSRLVKAEAILEQPSGSCLPKLQPLASVLAFLETIKTTTWLGSFGADHPKPLQLWHTNNIFKQLKRPKPQSCTTRLCTRINGKFRGRGNEMKQSQIYPDSFCEAVASLTLKFQDAD